MATKLIVITGISRGLGQAMAREFINQGHIVQGCGRSPQPDELTLKKPNHYSKVDVTNEKEVAQWAQRVIEQHGSPDLLLNNAAIINRNAPLWKIPTEQFNTLIEVNVKGVANVLRHFLPAMVEKQKGVIVNFSSGWGRSADAEVAPYCASKWAIEGLTQSLAQELPSGMAAVPLNPGIIDTDMLRSCFGGSASSYQSPQEWAAKAVPYLLKISGKDNGRQMTVS